MGLIKVIILVLLLMVFMVGEWKRMNHKKTEPMLGQNGPFGEALLMSQNENEPKAIPSAEFAVAGSLSIYLMREPSFETFSKGISGEDRYLNLWLDGDEWAALFFKVLSCPEPDSIPRLQNESEDEWERRYSLIFQRTIPEYPMLGRISDLFGYVTYRPEEIEQLRVECARVQSGAVNQKAISGLAKLTHACDAASKVNSGLLLAPQ